jgi:hypothetical protein
MCNVKMKYPVSGSILRVPLFSPAYRLSTVLSFGAYAPPEALEAGGAITAPHFS